MGEGISRLFSPSISHPCPVHFILEIPAGASTGNRGLKGRPNRKLIGGRGGGGDVHKKYSRKVKLNEKNSCLPINPKKYSCYGLKKIYTRNLITKKKLLQLVPQTQFSVVRAC